MLPSPSLFSQTKLSLKDAIQEALQTNPVLSASDARVAEAEGQRLQAGLRPNQRIVVQSEDVPFNVAPPQYSFANSTEEYLYAGQTIETAGKRRRRVDLADRGVQLSETDRMLVRRDLQFRVSTAYWAVANLLKNRELLEETLRTWDEDIRYSTNRVREGVMAEADLLRLQLERQRAATDLASANREVTQGFISLYRAMGRTSETPGTDLTDSLESEGQETIPLSDHAFEGRPELQMARVTLAEATANLRLQHANAKPDPEAFVGYKRNTGYNTLYAAVQMDLPIRNRNQGNIAAAEARVRAAESNLKLTELNLRADLESALRAYQDQLRLVSLFRDTLTRAQETERIARAAFREGGIDLLRMLDAIRTRIQTQSLYYRSLTDLRQAATSLRLSKGDLEPGVSFSPTPPSGLAPVHVDGGPDSK